MPSPPLYAFLSSRPLPSRPCAPLVRRCCRRRRSCSSLIVVVFRRRCCRRRRSSQSSLCFIWGRPLPLQSLVHRRWGLQVVVVRPRSSSSSSSSSSLFCSSIARPGVRRHPLFCASSSRGGCWGCELRLLRCEVREVVQPHAQCRAEGDGQRNSPDADVTQAWIAVGITCLAPSPHHLTRLWLRSHFITI